MIASSISRDIEELKRVWSKHLGRFPTLELDGTWPSIGIIDLMCGPLRLRNDLLAFEVGIVRGSACYLARFVHDCWESLGLVVEVQDGPNGVSIVGRSGPKHKIDGELTLDIEYELAQTLQNVPNPLPIFHDYSMFLSGERQFLPPLVLGWCSGLSPQVKGAWANRMSSSFGEEMNHIVRQLATQCADWYARVYPDEPLGQMAELYLHGLVYPPQLMDEEWPALNGVRALCSFRNELKIPLKSFRSFAINLAASPDELISHVGFAVAIGTLGPQEAAPRRLVAMGQSKGSYAGTLRPAVVEARRLLSGTEDWLEGNGDVAESYERIDTELSLNLLPWLNLTADKVSTIQEDNELRKVIQAIGKFDLMQALRTLKKIVDDTPQEIELRTQYAFLQLLNRDVAGAFESIKAMLAEPEGLESPRVNNLAGMVQLARGSVNLAEAFFMRARAQSESSPRVAAEIANNYGWTKLCMSKFDEALPFFDEALGLFPGHLLALINKVGVLFRLQDGVNAEAARTELLKLLPTDRRVFVGIAFDVIHENFAEQFYQGLSDDVKRAA